MSDSSSQTFLRDLDRKLWSAADRLLANLDAAVYLAEIAAHSFVFTPGRYVGAEDVEDDGEPFEEMARLVAELNGQFAESAKLEQAIKRPISKDLVMRKPLGRFIAPTGQNPSAQGCETRATLGSHPEWVSTLTGLHPPRGMIPPFQGGKWFWESFPKVGAERQPWAGCFKPVRLGRP